MLRTLLNFFLIGGLLFGARVLIEGRSMEGPEITVRVAADATEGEVESAIRDAILMNRMLRTRWVNTIGSRLSQP